MARGVIWISMILCAFALSACGDDDGRPVCQESVTVGFSSLSDSSLYDVSLSGLRIQLLVGHAEGYHDDTRWTLLLLRGAEIGLTLPCDATELELVIDQTQIGLNASLYAEADSAVPLSTDSSESAEAISGESPYERWTLALPEGEHASYVVIDVPGDECESLLECTSALIRSVTFR